MSPCVGSLGGLARALHWLLGWPQVERGSLWCFEQAQSLGGSNVSTNVRMTVIKLRSGGLFVHAPIAPTR